ncbi:hypothetical protein ACI48J_10440 [Paenibacillus chitinolyticus]|uniref:hypothetical protein n=1 Tax=Paenibacillus chitinolyticus TaxID=79263 RepID=UPI00386444C9
MARGNTMVPFGYEEEPPAQRGTLLIFETFEDWSEHEAGMVEAIADERKFRKVVFYPQHEESLKRMGVPCAAAYHKRVKLLEELLRDLPAERYTVDTWEGKRKKYTPVDTSLRFLTDKYASPYFIMMNDRYAAMFAGYKGFDEWIRKVRLLVWRRFGVPLPGKLLAYGDRLDFIGENGESVEV